MEKLYFIDIVEKYHLGGLAESVKFDISNKNLNIKFVSNNRNFVGIIEAPNFELKDSILGIYNTSQLLKLLKVTDNFITLDVEQKNDICTKLLIGDKNYNLEYILSNISLIPKFPTKIEEPKYEYEANLDEEFISKFVKAKKALDTLNFTVKHIKNNMGLFNIHFTLGGGEKNYCNKIHFDLQSNSTEENLKEVIFPLNEFSEILESNNDLVKGLIKVSSEGLMTIECINNKNLKTKYLLTAKEEL